MMTLILLSLALFLAVWIGGAELLRWKVTWFNQRPILTYFLTFCLSLLIFSLLGGDMTAEQEQAIEDAIWQELME